MVIRRVASLATEEANTSNQRPNFASNLRSPFYPPRYSFPYFLSKRAFKKDVLCCFFFFASYAHRLCLNTSTLQVLSERQRALWMMDQVNIFNFGEQWLDQMSFTQSKVSFVVFRVVSLLIEVELLFLVVLYVVLSLVQLDFIPLIKYQWKKKKNFWKPGNLVGGDDIYNWKTNN